MCGATVLATASMPGLASTPATKPLGPACDAASRASTPVPHATSSTCVPVRIPARLATCGAHSPNSAGTKNSSYAFAAAICVCRSVSLMAFSLLLIRSPVVFNVGRTLGRRAHAELDGREPVLFVQPARSVVLLVRVKLEPVGVQLLRQENERRPPAFAPLGGIDVHPIDVGARQRKKGHDVAPVRADPDVATRLNHRPEDFAGSFQRECLPRRKVWVRCEPGTMPHADDRRPVVIRERPDGMARATHSGSRLPGLDVREYQSVTEWIRDGHVVAPRLRLDTRPSVLVALLCQLLMQRCQASCLDPQRRTRTGVAVML